MEALWMVLGALVGAGVGAALGYIIGKLLASRAAWWFWVVAIVLVGAGVGFAFLGLQWELDSVFVAGVAFIGGGLTGLKYGARKVPGFGGGES